MQLQTHHLWFREAELALCSVKVCVSKRQQRLLTVFTAILQKTNKEFCRDSLIFQGISDSFYRDKRGHLHKKVQQNKKKKWPRRSNAIVTEQQKCKKKKKALQNFFAQYIKIALPFLELLYLYALMSILCPTSFIRTKHSNIKLIFFQKTVKQLNH